MITQGYPLWAVESDGTAYAVVGWDVGESISYPYLVPLDGRVRGAVRADDAQVFTYTTTDPTERPDINAVYYASEDLRERMHRLADETEHMSTGIARRIRQELGR